MKKSSIVIPLILILFLLTAVPAIIAISLNSHTMQKNSETAISESVLAKLQANQQYCDQLLSQYVYEALDFILDREYVELNTVTSYEELNSEYEKVRLALQMNDRMKNFVERSTLIYSAFFFLDASDYLVSTDAGLVRQENYGDISWVQDAIAGKKSPTGIWIAHKMKEQDEEKEILSYIYRSSNLYTSSKVTIVINIDEAKLSDLIFMEDQAIEGKGYLVDGQGNVLVHSDKRYLHQNLSKELEEILSSPKVSGTITIHNQTYAFQKSELYDWIYVNVYSNHAIFGESNQIFKISLVMTVLVIMFGVVCAVYLAMRITKPVRSLVQEVKGMNVQGEENESNELVFLSNALEQLKKREKQMENNLEVQNESFRRRSIHDLMHGEELLPNSRKLLEEYFPYHHFLVCILNMDNSVKYHKDTSHEERKIFRNMIYEHIREQFADKYICDYVRYDVNSIGILINMERYDSDKTTESISQILQSIQKKFKTCTNWGMTVGVSLIHDRLDDVQKCSEEARQALGRRLTEGKGKILFAHRFDNSDIQMLDAYRNQKRIMNYLELGEIEKIQEELLDIVNAIKHLEGISEDNVLLVFHQLLGDILIYLNKHNYNASAVLHEKQGNLYVALSNLETVEEMAAYVEHVLNLIIIYQKEEQTEKIEDPSQKILRYIQQNFRQDIDFEKMSEEIGISYSYARRLIKNLIGKSLIEYLNLIRVEEAKRFLEKSNMSMNEIGEAVGYHNVQSLYRAFKKYEGISPSTWREQAAQRDVSENT